MFLQQTVQELKNAKSVDNVQHWTLTASIHK